MNRLVGLAIGIGILCCATASAAEKETAGGQMLKVGIGARPAAMGEAFCAVGDIHYNPAGLAQIQKTQLCITHQDWLDDIRQQSVDYTRSGLDGGIGVSLAYLSMGKLEGSNVKGDMTDSFVAGNMALGLSYAKPLKEYLAVGVGLKMLQERISSEEATSVMADVGAILRLSESLSIGATLQNMGTMVKFINESDRLPFMLKVGGAYKTLKDRLLITVDISKPLDNDTNVNIGAEWKAMDILALRGGYRSGIEDQGNGFTAGAGFYLKGHQLDYAFVPYGDLGDTHRISYSFAGSK